MPFSIDQEPLLVYRSSAIVHRYSTCLGLDEGLGVTCRLEILKVSKNGESIEIKPFEEERCRQTIRAN